MSLFYKCPLQRGDRVIDDNGEIGKVHHLASVTASADGTVTDWAVVIRYDWDQLSYGKERTIGPRQASKLLPDGGQIDL